MRSSMSPNPPVSSRRELHSSEAAGTGERRRTLLPGPGGAAESEPIVVQPTHSGASWVMAVLEVLSLADPGDHPRGLTVTDVARALGRDRSVVSRQLRGLRQAELISRDDTGHHRLSWRLFSMLSHAGNQRLISVAKPLLAHLAELARERTYLSVLSNGEVLTVSSEGSRRMVEAANWVGQLVPVGQTSAGIALVSDFTDDDLLSLLDRENPNASPFDKREFLDRVHRARSQGYAVADGTFSPELLGIGAPVHDVTGRIIAALNISGPSDRARPNLRTLAGYLVSTTRVVERRLFHGDPS